MPNPFDQFDATKPAPAATSNPFDQFDHAPEPEKVGALAMMGRQFVAGGGDLINAIGSLSDALDPGSRITRDLLKQRIAEQGASMGKSPADIAAAQQGVDPASALAQRAHEYGDLTTNEVPSDFGARVAGGAARAVPSLAGAIATGGGASLEGLVPNAVRAVPYLGKLATGVAAGAPTAAVLTGEQSANLPDNLTPAQQALATAKNMGINTAMAGVPVALGESALSRALTGGALGYGTSAGAAALEGHPQDQAQNVVGAIMGALLGQHSAAPEVAPLDPHLAQYAASRGEPAPAGPPALPAPEAATPPAAVASPTPVDPIAAFKADPKAALSALDPVVLHQVASDAGFTIRPGTAPSTIIDTMTAKGTPFLHSDVLPEYMAAVQEHGLPSAASNAGAGAPPAPSATPPPPQDFAQALQAGATVPVDASGTAYTPQQGMASLSDALAKRATGGEPLPAPVTTVDSQGNAMDSAAFLAKTKAAQAEAEQQQNAVLNRQHLGITPDIERIQSPRWQAQQAAAEEAANRQSLQPDDEMVTQREDDSPPWWLAGQKAAEEAQAPMQPLQDAIKAPGPANAPMHPWTPLDASQSIPYAGGQSKDLSMAFIDKRIPQHMPIAGKNVDVHQAITLHENIESSLINNTKPWAPTELDALAKRVGLQSGKDFPALVQQKLKSGQALSYSQGHNIATKGENHFVAMTYGIPAAKYQMALQPAIKAALKQGAGAFDIPATLDSKPYDNMGESHLVPQQDDAYQQHLTDLAGERQAMSGDDRARAAAFLTDAGVPLADHDEALAMIQLADRAYSAGAEPRDILTDPNMTPSAKARALYDLAEKQENPRADPENGPSRPQADDGSSTQGLPRTRAANDQAVGQAAAAEQGRRVPAEAHQVAPSTDAFGTPASWVIRNKETGEAVMETFDKKKVSNLNTAKYEAVPISQHLSEVNDATSRTGMLARGKRPEQMGLDQADSAAEVTEHSLDDNTPEAAIGRQALERHRSEQDMERGLRDQMRKESQAQGEQDATSMGLRDAVSKALGGLGGNLKVEFVRNEMGLPEGSGLRVLPKGMRRIGTFMPSTDKVYIFTGAKPSAADAAFTAAHEVYGHRAMRMLAEAHPDVKVGNLTAPEALNKALDMAMQNPTVAKIAESMSKQRGSTDRRLIAEEAMADLSAAAQTGNWEKIKTKHGVDVPEGVRSGVKGAIANFLERMKRLLNALIAKFTGKPADFTDAQVHEFMQDSANALNEGGAREGAGKPLDSSENPTKTAAFEKWFGDSKVVDAKGEPLVVYHGTDKNFRVFDSKRSIGGQHWFTTDKSAIERGEVGAAGKGKVLDVYLSIKNPAGWKEYDKYGIGELKRDGYDGLALPDADGHTTYVAFEPNQIKSASRNKGTFDPEKNSILDQVDHEAVSQTNLSIPMVKEALRNRGVSEDAISAMSRDELRAEQSALRARSEPTPEQADTGVKNATKEEERAMKGKAEVEHDLSTSNQAQYATAKARFDADPHAGQILAAKVISEKKSITPEDSILLGLDAMRIINARQVAYEQAEKAMASGDQATRVAALSLVRQLDGQMEANDIAARYSGVRAGQALQARKVMIKQDYSMARMVLRAKVAKGEALTDAERSKVEAAAAAIAQRTKELDAREAKLRAMEAEARPVAQKRQAKAKFNDLVAELKAIAQKDHMNPGCVV